jgi:thiol-disulfide isomerase/thioredoxin
MAAVESTMLPLGTTAPDFELQDAVSGKTISLDSFDPKEPLLVMFICPHCPYVQHVQQELARMANEYVEKGVHVVAISSNDVEQYPEDGPEGLRKQARELGFKFPYCYDETQETAREYSAACTPDFFLFNKTRQLVYRGQFDDSRPRNDVPVTGRDLRKALDAVLAGATVDQQQKPSIGCNIKWKAGNEPAYYAQPSASVSPR